MAAPRCVLHRPLSPSDRTGAPRPAPAGAGGLLAGGGGDRRGELVDLDHAGRLQERTLFRTAYAPTARAMRRRIPPSCSDVTRDGVGLTRFIDTLLT